MKKYYTLLLLVLLSGMMRAQELNYPKDTIEGEEVYKYEVEKSIGLYRISVNFKVPQSEIIRLNPQLKERGLHYGETIYIPTGKQVDRKHQMKESAKEWGPNAYINRKATEESLAQKDTIAPVDTLKVVEIADTTKIDSVSGQKRQLIELALMLPFESQQTKRSANAERMMAFYQGVLLALHDLQNDSTLYRLRVYDTERSERRVGALCESNELDSVRGILGLAYPIQVERMSAWCATHKVPLLVPFADDVELGGYPDVFQFNSTDELEADSLCSWIERQNKRVHCVMIDIRESDMSAFVRTLRKKMENKGLPFELLPLKDLMSDSTIQVLDKESENLIILHSDKYQQVRLVLPYLTALQKAGYKMRLVGQYSWQKEKIGIPMLYTSVFTEKTDLTAYDELWNKYFGNAYVSELPRYDLLGYDLMHMLVDYLQGEESHAGLQSNVEWQQVGNGGWQNKNVRVIAE